MNEDVPESKKCKEPRMAGDLLGKRCFSSQHISHDLTDIQVLIAEDSTTETIFLKRSKTNLKEAVVKPELLTSSSSTRSLPIKSLNVVGDCGTVCGALLLDGLALCRACERERWSFAEPVDLEFIFNPILLSDNWFAMYSLTTDQISSPVLGRKVVVEGF